jgi:hypothetical protein
VYYYQPLEQCWYPDTGDLDFFKFKIPELTIMTHMHIAKDMWESPDTDTDDIVIIAA